MKKWDLLSIRTKLLMLFGLLILAAVASTGFLLKRTYDRSLEDRRMVAQQVVEAAVAIVADYQAAEKAGRLSHDDAQRRALEAIRAIRYAGTEYVWVNDDRPFMIMHPIKPELNGKDLSGFKDKQGKFLFVEFVRTVKASQSGYVEYFWPRPGSDVPVRKASFVKGVEGWNWIVGSGVYLDDVEAQFYRELRDTLIGLVLVLCMAGAAIWIFAKKMTVPLEGLVRVANRVREGDLGTEIDFRGSAEIMQLSRAFADMQSSLKGNIEREREDSQRFQRIKIALDSVSSGVMVADNERNIVYANGAVVKLLREAESELRKSLPHFSADRLIGENIDQFHKNPAHQAELLARFGRTHVAALRIGNRHLVVAASPVISAGGERLGSVAEWSDRTAEVLVEEEVSSLVRAAAVGDLSQRIALQGKDGFFASLGQELNSLLDNTDRALHTTSAVLAKVADGDLTQTVDADFAGIFGQLKDGTNTTVERLREVVGRISESTDAINTASQEIASGNSDLSSRTEEQASSLEETASSMEELTSTVKQNAENARLANDLASSAQQIAERGGAVVNQVVDTMGEINQSSGKIADIIGVIDGIAFQTNILALNAAVEAARAGEQGRGFAVVATEVRNLAQRSAAAAKEIKGLISDSVDKVQTGSRLVDQAGQTMGEVVDSIKKVAQIMADISAASREQSAGIEQVSLAITQMDEVTQQNAALVEEAAAAAESLEEQAHSLAQAVSVFRVDGSEHSTGQARLKAPQMASREGGKFAPSSAKIGGRKAQPALPASLEDEWSEF